MSEWSYQKDKLASFMRESSLPKPILTGTEWVNKNFYLSPESSAQAGKVTLYPYQEELMNVMTDNTTNETTFKKSARVGYTKLINMAVGYFIHQDPCSILLAQPTDDEAYGYAEDEIEPMIRDNAVISSLVYAKSLHGRSKKEKTTKKTYRGGILEVVGSHSPRNFRRRTVRCFIGDEIDGWELGAGEEGDQLSLGKKRTNDFWNRKIITGSTPKLKKSSKIQKEFLRGDQRYRYLPCPHCDHYQTLDFKQMSWALDDELYVDEDSVGFTCKECNELIQQHHHASMDKKGEWRATKPYKGHASFFIWSAYSYSANSNWVQIVKDWIEAESDHTKLQPFINTVLGEPYEEEFDKTRVEDIIDKKEEYDYEVPDGVVVLTCGVDTQDNRLEYEIHGWGAKKERWSIAKGVLVGDPATLKVWDDLDAVLLEREFESRDGMMKVHTSCIDRGGHKTEYVDEYCKTRASRNIYPILGSTMINAPAISYRNPQIDKKTDTKYFTPYYRLGVNMIKDIVNSGVIMTHGGGASYAHFPNYEDYDKSYFEQLIAEHKNDKGRWVKKHNNIRNEAIDLHVYAYGAYRIIQSKGINIDRLAAKGKRLFATGEIKKKRKKRGTISKGVEVY